MTNLIKKNKKLWNELTLVHKEESDLYSIAKFKSGENSLKKIELKELGDISGKSILHLQCHFGLDTLSMARMGAMVWGVDFSEESIRLAKKLSDDLKINANFICSDVYKASKVIDKKFDIIFTSYGVLIWLPDLDKWAKMIYDLLKSGGFFYIVEGHPFSMILKSKGSKVYVDKSYFNPKTNKGEKERDYANKKRVLKNKAYTWSHGLGEVITALTSAGLKIDYLHEFPFATERYYPKMKLKGGVWWLENRNKIPLTFSLKATRQDG